MWVLEQHKTLLSLPAPHCYTLLLIALGHTFPLSHSAALKLPPPNQHHHQAQPAWDLPVLIYHLQHQISTLTLSFLILLVSVK